MPRIRFVNCCWAEVNSRRASASVSAAITFTPNHGVRPLKLLGRLEPLAVNLQRWHQGLRREVRGKGIRQTQHGRELGTKQA